MAKYKIINEWAEEDRKCGCCNDTSSTFYAFAGQDVNEIGMCAYCFLEWLIESNVEVDIADRLVG